jgi:hypothetical protein
MKQILSIILTIHLVYSFGQQSINYLNNQTYTYDETIQIYERLVQENPNYCRLQTVGTSDYGKDLVIFLLNSKGDFSAKGISATNVLLVNNAIHPGEPCGVDASIKLIEEILENPKHFPTNITLAVIPIYNIGGAHNRGCCSRANQNGPLEYGFRGNAKNLDLNRDFIKADSKNTIGFYKLFHTLKPSIFVDTHTSNGADYQNTMTLITSQKDKMNPILHNYASQNLYPFLYQNMAKNGFPMVPYVHTLNTIPDEGIVGFLETPRYSTGYTNLFNTISFVTEAHMLKSYESRVESTYLFLKTMLDFMQSNGTALKKIKEKANLNVQSAEQFPINWKLNEKEVDSILFDGYTATYKKSLVTGLDRLYYNQNLPFQKYIPYFNNYYPSEEVRKPKYYIIPQAWSCVIDLLKANGIVLYEFTKDTLLNIERYYIDEFKTRKFPYEGHYLHHTIEIHAKQESARYIKGDILVPVADENARFIVEALEPHAVDSYFAWNYFDAILQQKEGFSPYVFEDEALLILKANPALKDSLESLKTRDKKFAESSYDQLYFIYTKSDHFEPTKNQYPITRSFEMIPKQYYKAVATSSFSF